MLLSFSKKQPSRTSNSKASKSRRMWPRPMSRLMERSTVQEPRGGKSFGALGLLVSPLSHDKVVSSTHIYSPYCHHHHCCRCRCCTGFTKVEFSSFILHWRVDSISVITKLLRPHLHQRRPEPPQQGSKCFVTESWIRSRPDISLGLTDFVLGYISCL